MIRVGMLTSGGDCQGLNAAMRGVANGLYETVEDVEMIFRIRHTDSYELIHESPVVSFSVE